MWTSDYRLLHARTEEIHANTMHTLVVVYFYAYYAYYSY